MSELDDARMEIIGKHLATAKTIIEWADKMPNLDEMHKTVLLSALATRESMFKEGMDEAETEQLCKWVTNCFMNILLISGVLRGHLGIRWSEGATQPSFCLTEEGKNTADILLKAENAENN